MRIRHELMQALRNKREEMDKNPEATRPWTDRDTAQDIGVEYELLKKIRGGKFLPKYPDCKIYSEYFDQPIGELFEDYRQLDEQVALMQADGKS